MQEKRRHFRKPVDYACEFNVADGAKKGGICRDLSLGGTHIDTDDAAPFGANITVYLKLKGSTTPSALPGIVRWVKGGSMGVQFGLLGARETYAITEMLAET
ncbi:MAG TPA: PilZ domain-containing protein [Polyangiaceae bacterium]|nr:PilZ domain-containing protein [Polyangiaceae bacterium]